MTYDRRYHMKVKGNDFCACLTSDLMWSTVGLSIFLPSIYTHSVIRLHAEMGEKDGGSQAGWMGKDGIYVNMLVGRWRIYLVLCEDWCHYTRALLGSLDSFLSAPLLTLLFPLSVYLGLWLPLLPNPSGTCFSFILDLHLLQFHLPHVFKLTFFLSFESILHTGESVNLKLSLSFLFNLPCIIISKYI